MRVTAGFLEGAAQQLEALAAALDDSATAASTMFGSVEGRLDGLAAAWGGPRSDAVIGQSRSYLSVVSEFPAAVESARETVVRWSARAAEFAAMLAVAEARVRSLLSDPVALLVDEEARRQLSAATSQIEEINVQWQTSCTRFAGELSSALAAVNRSNDAVAVARPSPAVVASMVTATMGSPSAIATWWARLSPTEQVALAGSMRTLIGGLDGIPAGVRDLVNRIQLVSDLARLQALEATGAITQLRRRMLESARNIVDVLASHEAHDDPLTNTPVVSQLYVYEPAAFGGDGRAAISVGDLDTAAHVAVSVPGLFSSVRAMGAGTAQNIYDEARWASGDGVAVLDWMGYDSPNFNLTPTGANPETTGDFFGEVGDVAGVLDRDKAAAGAALLAADVAGINAMRTDPHLTVIGNSYGSTTVAIAAHQHDLEADDVILSGSPGAGDAEHASELSTGTEHTWVASASRDLVTYLGDTGGWDPADELARQTPGVEQLGNDPSEDAFGANRIQAESVDREGGDGDRGIGDINVDDHGRYYREDTESLYNVGAIVGGEYELVVEAPHRHKDPVVETHNPIDEFDVDVDGGVRLDAPMCDVPGPFDVPCGIPDVDAHLDVDVDVDLRSPVDVNLLPDDPEGSRTPTEMTHER
jgi:hypothetical protein